MYELLYRKEVCLYTKYGYFCFVYNPFGRFWNIWMLTIDYEISYHGICFHSDLWYCIYALLSVIGGN